MKIKTTTPAATNKYYLMRSYGGYSPCVAGNTKHGLRPYKGSVLPNCVGLAVGFYNFLLKDKSCSHLGSANAEDFIALAKRQGLEVGTKPRPGAIAVWSKGKTGTASDGAGHVAPVIATNWTDSITVWQSGWNYTASVTNVRTYKKGTGNWGKSSPYKFIGFIYCAAICPYRDPSGTVKKGSKGNDARFVQWCLWKAGCFKSGKKSEIDGKFGARSVEALKLFQKKHGLAQDGHAGPATQKVMKNLYTLQ